MSALRCVIMSKRPHEDSVFSKTSGSSEPGSLVSGNNFSINELLSNSEEPEGETPGSQARKPRNFIAAVVHTHSLFSSLLFNIVRNN